MPSNSERWGVLVIRAWIESGTGVGVRARVTSRTKGGQGSSTATVEGVDAVVRAVDEWLEDIEAGRDHRSENAQ